MSQDTTAIVLDAVDAVFNRRDFDRARAAFSPEYVQHSRLVPAGLDGLLALARSLPAEARYEAGLAVAQGDRVMVHGRFSGMGDRATIAVDIFRLEDGVIVEHWDVLQEEATQAESAGGHPMFGDRFAESPLV